MMPFGQKNKIKPWGCAPRPPLGGSKIKIKVKIKRKTLWAAASKPPPGGMIPPGPPQ
ncbi:MAG: hypothetical protein HW380_2577 [Magnetococcales bacterium]|nr:hypothetical protein [Magnetococcales bacterium]